MSPSVLAKSWFKSALIGTVTLTLSFSSLAEDCQIKAQKYYARHMRLTPSSYIQKINDEKMARIVRAALFVSVGEWSLHQTKNREMDDFFSFAMKLEKPELEASFSWAEGADSVRPVHLALPELAHYLAVASLEGMLCPGDGTDGIFKASHYIRRDFRSGWLQSRITAIDDEIRRQNAAARTAVPLRPAANTDTKAAKIASSVKSKEAASSGGTASNARPLLAEAVRQVRAPSEAPKEKEQTAKALGDDPYGLLDFFSYRAPPQNESASTAPKMSSRDNNI